jgi:molybdopterin-containing oxidoreductase family iron-sulfur binding subunit
MEKCTFCIQRIRRAKEDAKLEGRPIRDGEIQTACSQTCPPGAIVFGNLADPESRVFKLARSKRRFRLLEDLGTEPSVVYLKGGGREDD